MNTFQILLDIAISAIGIKWRMAIADICLTMTDLQKNMHLIFDWNLSYFFTKSLNYGICIEINRKHCIFVDSYRVNLFLGLGHWICDNVNLHVTFMALHNSTLVFTWIDWIYKEPADRIDDNSLFHDIGQKRGYCVFGCYSTSVECLLAYLQNMVGYAFVKRRHIILGII